MKAYLLFPLLALLLCSCSSAQPRAPRFDKPSTAPLHQAADNTGKKIDAARGIAKQIEAACPEQAVLVDQLGDALDEAKVENAKLQGALETHDAALEQQTTRANGLADDYDKAGATIVQLRESRHKWVKSTWLLSASLLGALAWIFKGPLMFVLRKFVGLPF